MLVHLVELAPLEGDPVANYEAVRAELSSYGAGLDRLPELVVLSKRDLLPGRGGRGGAGGVAGAAGRGGLGVLAVSSATGEGLDELRDRILSALPETPPGPRRSASRRRVRGRAPRLPAGGRGWLLGRARGRRWLPHPGRGVELLFERHDIGNEEALAYLEQRLNEIGVVAALAAAGFEPGDDVRVGEHEFELHVSRGGRVSRSRSLYNVCPDPFICRLLRPPWARDRSSRARSSVRAQARSSVALWRTGSSSAQERIVCTTGAST